MSGNNLMLVPYVKLAESPSGYFFWLENDTARRHIGTSVCFYNEDTKQLRIAQWVLRKNAKLWGIRIENHKVVVVTPEMADGDAQDKSEEPEHEQVMLQVRKQLDKIQQAINTISKLLD